MERKAVAIIKLRNDGAPAGAQCFDHYQGDALVQVLQLECLWAGGKEKAWKAR